jgi:hypothetical protein
MIETGQRIVVVDLRIPFVRLVLFFVKAALAAIPAAIIIGFLLMLVTALFASLAGDGGDRSDLRSRDQPRRYSVGGRGSSSSG